MDHFHLGWPLEEHISGNLKGIKDIDVHVYVGCLGLSGSISKEMNKAFMRLAAISNVCYTAYISNIETLVMVRDV